MSPASSRKSIDSLASGASTPSLSLSQYSFSQLDSPRGPPQKYALRRGSTASSIASIGGILDPTPSHHHGSIAESSQNAISTLLQPPIVRTGLVPHTAVTSTGYKAPTSRDIPPVTLTNIPHVDSKVFQSYLTQVGTLYDTFQQGKDSNADQDILLSREPKLDDFNLWKTKPSERRHSAIAPGSPGSSTLDVRDTRDKKRPSFSRRGHTVSPLSTIPTIYFEDDFHLENPRVFDVVSERSEVVRSQPQPQSSGKDETAINGAPPASAHTGRKALATNAILQEKLSWYMDTVEIHLISSISTASRSFFTALGSLRELHSEAADSVKRIQNLRRDLQKIDKEMALGGLKIVNLRRRRENVRLLSDAVAQLRQVVDSLVRCEELVESGNIEEAADGLDRVERLMSGGSALDENGSEIEHRKQVDLRRLKALERVSDDLAQLRYRIGMGYESRFLADLLGDLKRHVESVPVDDTLQRWGSVFSRQRGVQRQATSASPPAYMNFDEQLRSKLYAHLSGLARAHHATPAVTSVKAAVLREMKVLIRKHLPSSSDDDNESMVSVSTHSDRQLSQQEKSLILARNLRALDPEDAYTLLVRVYTGVSESLRRLGVQVKVLLDIASGFATPSSPGSKSSKGQNNDDSARSETGHGAVALAQDEMLQVLDMSSLLGQAVDIAQSQIIKVLKVRSEQTSQLPTRDFLAYFTLNRLFADECEAVSGRSGTTLKTLVGNQIKDYIARFGEGQRHSLVEVMDGDRWDARDFGDDENAILSRILDASTKDIETWTEVSKIWLSTKSAEQLPSRTNGTVVNGAVKEKTRSAVIDEQRYILPESAVAMMKSIEAFEFLISNIPSMAQDISSNLLESLKLFNSRSSQLILGAGATRSAGLKNITTKHLALSSQALSFVIALVPYVREFVRRHLQSSPLVAEFDKVKRLCQDHQSGIHEKLVDIMSSRSSVHVTAMRKVDWDAATDATTISPYMETLAKETGTLHRVLSKHLPENSVSTIMTPVFTNYRNQWSTAFHEAMVKTETGKKRMLSDVEYLDSKLSKIAGSADVVEHLLDLIKSKPITSEVSATESKNTASPPAEATQEPPPARSEEKAEPEGAVAQEHDAVEAN